MNKERMSEARRFTAKRTGDSLRSVCSGVLQAVLTLVCVVAAIYVAIADFDTDTAGAMLLWVATKAAGIGIVYGCSRGLQRMRVG